MGRPPSPAQRRLQFWNEHDDHVVSWDPDERGAVLAAMESELDKERGQVLIERSRVTDRFFLRCAWDGTDAVAQLDVWHSNGDAGTRRGLSTYLACVVPAGDVTNDPVAAVSTGDGPWTVPQDCVIRKEDIAPRVRRLLDEVQEFEYEPGDDWILVSKADYGLV